MELLVRSSMAAPLLHETHARMHRLPSCSQPSSCCASGCHSYVFIVTSPDAIGRVMLRAVARVRTAKGPVGV